MPTTRRMQAGAPQRTSQSVQYTSHSQSNSSRFESTSATHQAMETAYTQSQSLQAGGATYQSTGTDGSLYPPVGGEGGLPASSTDIQAGDGSAAYTGAGAPLATGTGSFKSGAAEGAYPATGADTSALTASSSFKQPGDASYPPAGVDVGAVPGGTEAPAMAVDQPYTDVSAPGGVATSGGTMATPGGYEAPITASGTDAALPTADQAAGGDVSLETDTSQAEGSPYDTVALPRPAGETGSGRFGGGSVLGNVAIQGGSLPAGVDVDSASYPSQNLPDGPMQSVHAHMPSGALGTPATSGVESASQGGGGSVLGSVPVQGGSLPAGVDADSAAYPSRSLPDGPMQSVHAHMPSGPLGTPATSSVEGVPQGSAEGAQAAESGRTASGASSGTTTTTKKKKEKKSMFSGIFSKKKTSTGARAACGVAAL